MTPSLPDPAYAPFGIAMLRMPLLPIETLPALLWPSGDASVADAFEHALAALRRSAADPLVQEALLLSSPDLVAGLARSAANPQRKRSLRAWEKLYCYLARMATRPTPFGICAGVALSRVGDETHIIPGGIEEAITHTRPDMRWLLEMIERLEHRREVIESAPVVPHPAACIIGERLYLPQNGPDNEEAGAISLRATPFVRTVLALSARRETLCSLKEHLCAQYLEVPQDHVEAALERLRSLGVLFCGLRPPLTGADPLGSVLDEVRALPDCDELFTCLQRVAEAIAAYDAVPPGKGLASLQALSQQMEHLVAMPSTPLVATDLRLSCAATISRSVLLELAQGAETLLRLSTIPVFSPHLAAYRARFLERYGRREVPLVELLDETLGLGPVPWERPLPQGTTTHESYHQVKRNRLLIQIAVEALRERCEEIELDETMVKRLENSDWRARLPPSLEIYAQLAAPSQEAVNAGNYLAVIAPRIGAQPAGRSFGRFCRMLGEDAANLLREITQEEERLDPACLFAELVYAPSQRRATNVVLRPAMRRFEVPLTRPSGAAETIALDDLVVGVDQQRFYLWSLERACEVRITETHLLNPAQALPICRFLTTMMQEGLLKIASFDWGAARQLPYLPRVRIGRIVLAPARWQIDCGGWLDTDEQKRRRDPDVLGTRLRQWCEQWRTPRYVYLREPGTDRRLFLDLAHPLCLQVLSEACWKLRNTQNRLILEEMLPGFETTWVKGPAGHFITELVVPFKRQEAQPRLSSLAARRVPALFPTKDHLRLPGTEWLSAHLYVSPARQNKLLVESLPGFIARVQRQEGIGHWFFVRYADPEPHIRLRFHGDPRFLLSEVLPQLTAWAEQLVQAGRLRKMTLECYDREIERYGGEEGLRLAEQFFALDSATILEILPVLLSESATWTLRDLGICTVDHWLACLGQTPAQRRALYAQLAQGHEATWAKIRPAFHRDRKRILRLLLDHAWLAEQPGGPQVLAVLTQCEGASQALAEHLHALVAAHRLSTTPARFLSSCVHLHCNRLGLTRQDERIILLYLWQALESLEHYRPPEIGLPESLATSFQSRRCASTAPLPSTASSFACSSSQ